MRTACSSSCHGGSPSPPPEQTPPGAGPLPSPQSRHPPPPWSRHWSPLARSPSTSPLGVGLDQIPLNFPLGCGPGPDPPQLPPWVWAWTRSPQLPPWLWAWRPPPFWRLAARHAGIPPIMHAGIPPPTPPPVNRITDRCKNITLPQTSFAGGKNVNVANLESVTGKLNSVCDCKIAKSSFRQSLSLSSEVRKRFIEKLVTCSVSLSVIKLKLV